MSPVLAGGKGLHHASMRRLWLIDDTPSLHRVADATRRLAGDWEFTSWYSGAEAIEAIKLGEPWPDVILMDYYIGHERGHHVAARLRELEPADLRPVIVGYSSVRSASQAIVEAGGDLIVSKHQDGRGINPSLLEFLKRWK